MGIISNDLLNDSRLSLCPIQVTINDGVVTLIGSVQSYRRKLAAQQIAGSFSGVREVINNLSVEPPEPATDGELADRVRAALDASADVIKETVTVAVYGGKVALRGTVASRWERLVAEDVARSVRGVRDVQNMLVVNLKERLDDQQMSAAISAALRRIPGFADLDVAVAVCNNTVVFSGEVPTLGHRDAANQVAEGFSVTHVRNDLIIGR